MSLKTEIAAQMKIELNKAECELEDGSRVTNLEGICQRLIGRALDGDLNTIEYIAKLTAEEEKKRVL